MNCQDCEVLLAGEETSPQLEQHLHECDSCRSLAEDLRENAGVLAAMKQEDLPKLSIRVPRTAKVYPWLVGAAAAAALVIALLLPRPSTPVLRTAPQPPVASVSQPPEAPSTPQKAQPLKIKMLTSDPDVVIYWIVD